MVTRKGILQEIIKILVSIWLLVNITYSVAPDVKEKGIFYILMWTHGGAEPFIYWPRGIKASIVMNCQFQNCYFTDNRTYFQDPVKFDAILFNAPNIHFGMEVPVKRSTNQFYVFVSTESEANFPVTKTFNNFFNYTWTYKLDSDIVLPYFYARNRFSGKIVAPKSTVHWRSHDKMKPAPEYVIEQLQNKTICAAWFVTNCFASNRRLNYIQTLRSELHKFGLEIDIFGGCDANKQCPKTNIEDCFELVRDQYFFYLAFENKFSNDYVTEKLMTAVNNYAVPVVFGGADYSRFLPDGAYINARRYSPTDLASKMHDVINNISLYYDYFKFYRYYTYHTIGQSADTDPLCTFCKFINNRSTWSGGHVFPRFSLWWNSHNPVTSKVNRPNLSDVKLMEDFPEWWQTSTVSENSNFVVDILNHYFNSK